MFPKNDRVPKEKIKKVLFEGQKTQTELFLLRKKENNLKNERVAIVVSKKNTKSAVKRHYLKRLYKSIIREYIKNNPKKDKNDWVFVLNKKAAETNKNDIMSVLKNLN